MISAPARGVEHGLVGGVFQWKLGSFVAYASEEEQKDISSLSFGAMRETGVKE